MSEAAGQCFKSNTNVMLSFVEGGVLSGRVGCRVASPCIFSPRQSANVDYFKNPLESRAGIRWNSCTISDCCICFFVWKCKGCEQRSLTCLLAHVLRARKGIPEFGCFVHHPTTRWWQITESSQWAGHTLYCCSRFP